MPDTKLIEVQQYFRQVSPETISRFFDTIKKLKECRKTLNILVGTPGTDDEQEVKRKEADRLFLDMVQDHFSELLKLTEVEPIFTPSEDAIASYQIQYRHKTIKIHIIGAGGGSKDGDLMWYFYFQPLPALKQEFDSWSNYLLYSEGDNVRQAALRQYTSYSDLSHGRDELLHQMMMIDRNHENEMAKYQPAKEKAIEQMRVVEELSGRIQARNERLRQLVEASRQKIQELIAEAQNNAWKWPEKALTLFEIKWQIGSGYSLSDETDEKGYFTLLPEVSGIFVDNDQDSPGVDFKETSRKLKPGSEAQITKLEITDIDCLPSVLRVIQYLSVELTSHNILGCNNLGEIYNVESLNILKSEGDLWALESFPRTQGQDFWNHKPIAQMPIEEIRLALQD